MTPTPRRKRGQKIAALQKQVRRMERNSSTWIVYDRVESRESVVHVVVGRLEDLSHRLADLKPRSRDFR